MEPASLQQYEDLVEEGILDFLAEEGKQSRKDGVKIMAVIRGYVFDGLWFKASNKTFEEGVEHTSSGLKENKKSFDEVFKPLVMGALYYLERKNYLTILQNYLTHLVGKVEGVDVHEKIQNATQFLEEEYRGVKRAMNDSAEKLLKQNSKIS